MKKLRKYQESDRVESINKKIDTLSKLNISIINSGKKIFESPSAPLSVILPIIATSLNPLSLIAQCGIATTTSGGGDLTLIDIDGDGTNDFVMDPSPQPGNQALADLFLGVQNGAEIMAASVGGGFFYATRFSGGSTITSGNANWRDAAELPTGGGGAGDQATLDYQSNGNWHGSGTVTGYVGIRIDGNKMGFLEVSWDNSSGIATLNLANSGVQDVDNAGNISLTIGACALLPVELILFDGRVSETTCFLRWKTGSEINNEGFEVQRSLNGKEYTTIHWVEGQGNTTTDVNYNYQDKNLDMDQMYYYRLKQMDYSGSFEYSEIISLKTEGRRSFSGHIKNANPIQNSNVDIEVYSTTEGTGDLFVFSASGQTLISQKVQLSEGDNNLQVDLDNMAAGNYFIKIHQGSDQIYLPIIIQ